MTYNEAWGNSGGSRLTIGSLFDGSGTAPLAAAMCGIEPVWCSEVEPFCIAVTRARFPKMKHYGNICDIKGDKIEPIDIICGGSPCQDLSVAGKRAGLDGGERSVLFHEQIRIIKEMRNATNNIQPRFAVWENVPGAFSSNKGEDFRCVLEAFCKIADESADIPRPKKWAAAGCIVGDGWSVAYRTLDAQYWGVPQRRRRIFLVADFRSERAGQILFESEGVSRDITEGGETGQGVAGNAENGAGAAGGNECIASTLTAAYGTKWNGNNGAYSGGNFAFHSSLILNDQGGDRMDISEGVTATLRAEAHHPPIVTQSSGFCTEHSAKSRSVGYEEERSPTLRAGVVPGVDIENHPTDGRRKLETAGKVQTLTSRMGTGGMNTPLVLDTPTAYGICSKDSNSMKSDNPHSGIYEADTSRTLDANGGNPACNQGGIVVVEGNGSRPSHKGDGYKESDVMYTLNTIEQHAVVYAIDRESYNCGQNYARKMGITEDGINSTLNAQGPSAVAAPVYSSSKASFFTSAEEELANTLVATDYKDPPIVNDVSEMPEYIVHRLTPTECARLQGFPDYWCSDLGIENPTEEDISFWLEVWETHRKIIGKSSKPKTRKQIIKWLKHPHSDSAEYKMWGNGMALPCVLYIMQGLRVAGEPAGILQA